MTLFRTNDYSFRISFFCENKKFVKPIRKSLFLFVARNAMNELRTILAWHIIEHFLASYHLHIVSPAVSMVRNYVVNFVSYPIFFPFSRTVFCKQNETLHPPYTVPKIICRSSFFFIYNILYNDASAQTVTDSFLCGASE